MGTPCLCMGSALFCSFGVAPSSFTVLPEKRVMVSGRPVATIMDFKPLVNILPFAVCSSKTNPAVISVMASTLGAVQVAPCVPATTSPWQSPSPTVKAGQMQVLNFQSKLMCQWGGQIVPVIPGQFQTVVA